MKKFLMLCFSALFIYEYSTGQAGFLDPSFGNGGVVRTDLSDHFDQASAIGAVQQKDGKIVVLFSERTILWLARYYSNGSPDPSFPLDHFNHRFYFMSGANSLEDMILLSDGRILVSGSDYADVEVVDFALYEIDGRGDVSTFSSVNTSITPKQQDIATAVVQQPDGKIVQVGTTFTGTNWNFAVVRYKADLTLDSSFSSDGKLTTDFSGGDDKALSVVIQKDGKILVGGYSTVAGSTKKNFAIARYNPNGTPDFSFSGDGKLTTSFSSGDDVLQSLSLQGDGKIVAGGYAAINDTDFVFARYTTYGALDNSFSGDGKLNLDLAGNSTDILQGIAVQNDGRILAGGYTRSAAGNSDFALVRLNPSGTLDSLFQGRGINIIDMGSANDVVSKMTLLDDGRILMVGHTGDAVTDLIVARFTASGAPDKSFQGNGKMTDYLRSYSVYNALVTQNDGKIIAGGYTKDILWYFSDNAIAMARYLINGQLDNTFSKDGIQKKYPYGAFDQKVSSMAVQKDGKIVVAGTATTSDESGPSDFIILRYNKDGSLDTTFGPGMPDIDDAGNPIFQKGWMYVNFLGNNGDLATSVVIQPDGKILVSGISDNYDVASKLVLVRLLPDGTPDKSFGVEGKKAIPIPSSSDYGLPNIDGGGEMVLQPDGRILVSEWSYLSIYVDSTNSIENRYYVAVLRLLPGGAIDGSFGKNGIQILDSVQSVRDMKQQADGKIVLALSPGYTLARLKPNGSFDTTFAHKGWTTSGFPGVDGGFTSLAIQSDGKIIAGGSGNRSWAIARYKSNGTLDSSFATNGLQISTSITSQGLPGFSSQDELINALQIQGNRLYAAGWSLSKGDVMATTAAYNLDIGMFTYYRDVDQDGYGNSSKSVSAARQPWGYVLQAGDCNDNNAAVYPGAPELCDGLDNNCNGAVDEGLAQKTFYRDYDFDGYGDIRLTARACAAPPGYASKSGDCHNADKTIYPGAPELCDGKDNNCDGTIDEGCPMVAPSAMQKSLPASDGLSAVVFPNPSAKAFSIVVQSSNSKAVKIKVTDVSGRLIEQREGVRVNSLISIGGSYKPGVYMAEILQENKRVSLRMIKRE